MRIDPDTVTQVIREVVDDEVLPRFRALGPGDVRTKTGPQDLVTEADLRAEVALSRRLTELLPGSQVVGEEAIHAHPEGLRALREADPVWVIDPVDGTGNFAAGHPLFACIVALVHQGQTLMGWIDHCLERRTTVAVSGGGTWCAGQPVHLTPALPSAALVGHVGGRPFQRALEPHVRVERVGSAAHAYLAMLAGTADFAAFTRMKVWDHAAGILMIQEAGGAARLHDGRAYAPTLSEGHPLLARDEPTWTRLAALLSDKAGEARPPQTPRSP
ncbi:inositol monophosphatase family protein [Pararhodospirillum photometricum]|uniref:Inositol monophosphatase n=1 Tax=Pararhodospirillum photometricum DSM 122 TaxID=1150469 RepID=H6SSF9_PARPM|nr:inositol monophosphatase family protein [Pararhodospirillum photometricum]CCG07838.1 Inositol monophosphatase [Pararhodospirillum photometricum DSM 122]